MNVTQTIVILKLDDVKVFRIVVMTVLVNLFAETIEIVMLDIDALLIVQLRIAFKEIDARKYWKKLIHVLMTITVRLNLFAEQLWMEKSNVSNHILWVLVTHQKMGDFANLEQSTQKENAHKQVKLLIKQRVESLEY